MEKRKTYKKIKEVNKVNKLSMRIVDKWTKLCEFGSLKTYLKSVCLINKSSSSIFLNFVKFSNQV